LLLLAHFGKEGKPELLSPQSVRKLWQRWWVQLARE
jgi:hypothetical protein